MSILEFFLTHKHLLCDICYNTQLADKTTPIYKLHWLLQYDGDLKYKIFLISIESMVVLIFNKYREYGSANF